MSDPVIRGISVDPPVVAPGGSCTITVDAFDPDDGTFTVEVRVRDSSGNQIVGTAAGSVKDTLSYEAIADRGTITAGSQSHIFIWTDGA